MPINFRSWFSPATKACPICGRSVSHSVNNITIPIRHPLPRQILSSLCVSCRQAIPWISKPICRICGRAERCEDCTRRQQRNYSISRCSVRYDNLMKDWLALYKYRGNEQLETILAAMLAFAYERICEYSPTAFDFITAVPLAPERLQDRGFNQAERLALHLSQWYKVSYRPMLLRLRHTEKQSLKTRRSRVIDMRGNFSAVSTPLFYESLTLPAISPVASPAATSKSPTPISIPPRIMLVDDIYTTGSTLDECARVLRQAANPAVQPEIYGLLWARS
jgi:competence protein ComFC